ncbi:hypothetical protein GIB67_008757 [Kingdonia uniflora]|uniref:Uncharacterized protein n=1 Tax=Kingdonia uniflora TaxID=39325 RepID=A0A7J7P602_9MAGN|nr:hypothetical protein GIB67_039607 [Kingdonia uniflora]KAF6174702.1 hypothetical protein GIB67_008757 [Kingdonia uniflora]
MRFSSVVLVDHDDRGLLVLMAAQQARESGNPKHGIHLFDILLQVQIRGIVLIGVSLSREVVPAFAMILLRTSLGKTHLVRHLLRTEITQVVNRRSWYDATKLTTEILNLYKDHPLVCSNNTIDKGRLVAVSECDHLPYEECPKALLAALLPFISRLISLTAHRHRMQRH